jgi:NADPH:quinone reductase-like Zn-dependent oxidoreductase
LFDLIGGDTLARPVGIVQPGGTLVSVAAPGVITPHT